MKYKYILKSFVALACTGALAGFTACTADDYADINTNPQTVSKPNIPYLLTSAEVAYQPFDYLMWFYNGSYASRLDQAYTPSGSFGDQFNKLGALGGEGSQFVGVKIYENDIAKTMTDDKADGDKYKNIKAMANALSVSLGIFDSDMFGPMPYSEAAQLKYGGTVTPKYDTQQELYNEWIKEINEDIEVFKANNAEQIQAGSNDIFYKGDVAKWLKFANGVKLRLAVRLLHADKAQAIKMAEEVGASEDNVMNGLADDCIYNKSEATDGGDNTYGTGNGVGMGATSKNVMDFMMRNRDPRLLVMFTKNDFNSEVIQAFFDAQAGGKNPNCQIPKYILDNVEYTTDADGHKHFKAWKGDGEPWVRYYGVPVGINLTDNKDYTGDNNYFVSTRWQITENGATKSYYPCSGFNEEMVRGRCTYTFPTAPGGAVVQDKDPQPLYSMTISTAEMNLYLAEFKLLGANLPKTAEEYFKAGVKASVEEYNKLAQLNKIPYSDKQHCNDPYDKPVTFSDAELQSMIESLLARPEYKLTGDKAADLEKVYLQEYLHFYYQPIDQFVTARRSGVPKVGSSLIPWVNLLPNTQIPRRFYMTKPDESDKMKAQKEAAYQKEGLSFTDGQEPDILNSERIWIDKNAPAFGLGPNY